MGASCDDGRGMAGDGCGKWVACEIAACVETDWVGGFEWGSMAELGQCC